MGTLFAWASFAVLRPWMSDFEFLLFLLVAFVGGVPLVHRTGVALGVIDHGSIVWDEIVPFWLVLLVWDEIVPFWLVLLFCPGHWLWQAVAFALFRCFDIVKPEPARQIDEKLKNGLGVMCDDLVAAAYTLLVLALLRFVFA